MGDFANKVFEIWIPGALESRVGEGLGKWWVGVGEGLGMESLASCASKIPLRFHRVTKD